jgi:alanine racemase
MMKISPATYSTKPSKDKYDPTWMEIDLSAIRHNFLQVKKRIGRDVLILAPVKANGYGHGILQVSRIFADLGVDYLGVGTISEALFLRNNGFRETPILMLGSVLPAAAELIIKNNITQAIADMRLASAINRQAKILNKKVKIHIKIDTGMGRIGIWHENAKELIHALMKMKNLEIEGIFSHLSSADDSSVVTHQQINDFLRLTEELELSGIKIHYRHIANSMAVIDYKSSHMNLIRPGIILYGLSPGKGLLDNKIQLRPAMQLKSRIVFLKNVPSGRYIGYGGTYRTIRHTVIATIPIGYGDGLNRVLSNRGYVIIRGEKAPIVGRVCMDQIMVDVGSIKGVRLSDTAVIIGHQNSIGITVEDMAYMCDTIPYEILCCFDKRIPKIYKI